MPRVSAGTPSPLNGISVQDSTPAKWKSTQFSQRPDSVKALSQSLSLSLNRMRNPQVRQTVMQAAPTSLDISIKSQSSNTTSVIRGKQEFKEGLNTSIKNAYRDFLEQNKSTTKKENHEVLTFTLDKQISKLRAGANPSASELANIADTMEKVSTWLSSKMTGEKIRLS